MAVMAQLHIYASCGCARARAAIPLPAQAQASAAALPWVMSVTSPPLLRRGGWAMGASDHAAVAAAASGNGKPRARRPSAAAAAVLGEPVAASDDHGLVHPSADFASQALVSSTQQVIADTRLSAFLTALPISSRLLSIRSPPRTGGASRVQRPYLQFEARSDPSIAGRRGADKARVADSDGAVVVNPGLPGLNSPFSCNKLVTVNLSITRFGSWL